MNIIVNNDTNLVWVETGSAITESNGVFFVDGISSGVSVVGNTAINDATPCTFASFVSQAFTYIDGVWGIYNQSLYDSYLAQYNSSQRKKREATYTVESDPVFFKWQRGEATQQQWLDKIEEIKLRYPYQV